MKKKHTVKIIFVTAVIVILIMLLLQLFILTVNNIREAKSTTKAYLAQAESIIDKNKQKEKLLLSSLKEDYTVLAKAVSYYLDHDPEAVDDVQALQTICSLMSIDEIHVFDETGKIIASTVPDYVGYTFHSGEQISYFIPMLSDKSLTMCQDVTPNTADGKPMVYAITWNEAGNQMVQVGIESVRLMEEFELNNIQATVEDIAMDEDMSIIVADAATFEVVGSDHKEYLSKQLSEVSDIDQGAVKDNFFKRVKLADQPDYYFCSTDLTEDYCICVFLSYHFFAGRTAESILVVFIYLLAAFAVILAVIRKLISSREENDRHMQVFQSMSEIYYSLHLLNLKKDTVVEYSSRNQVKEVISTGPARKATELMPDIMKATMSDEYLQRGLEFSNLSTISERMRDKKIISKELLGKNVGWIRMSFITVEAEDGVPTQIIVATQIIDEEKREAERLYEKSHVDEMTGCFNRRAYNKDLLDYENCSEGERFAYISFDVNGLKTINDTLGHEAGDELISSAADCMKKVFSPYGKVYRLGGDEFAGLLNVDEDQLRILCDDFDSQISTWHGKWITSISVSYGCVLSGEAKGLSMNEIAALADKRMYESKANHYKQKGIDRRRR